MKYSQFKNKFQVLPIIFSKDVMRFEKDSQTIRNQLNRWQAKGLINKLRRGIYLLTKNDRKINPGKIFIANQLYAPSYVSLEYALGFYGLIPERVSDVTSLSTRKTIRFQNESGLFIYQHIKPAAFRGFKKYIDDAGLSYFIADPEKAVVDFLYFNLDKFSKDSKGLFGSYRFQNVNILKSRRIIEFAGIFNDQKLMNISKKFCEFIKKEVEK